VVVLRQLRTDSEVARRGEVSPIPHLFHGCTDQ